MSDQAVSIVTQGTGSVSVSSITLLATGAAGADAGASVAVNAVGTGAAKAVLTSTLTGDSYVNYVTSGKMIFGWS